MQDIHIAAQDLLNAAINEVISHKSKLDSFRAFNVFNVLDIKSKEVIMCRFLCELLSPDGNHGMGKSFLEYFLEVVGRDKLYVATDDARVSTEYVITNNRRIDILIKSSSQIVPIEVKIYAGEQDNQVEDYLIYCDKYTEDNDLKYKSVLIFLTLDGREPSSIHSAEDDQTENDRNKRIVCISFTNQIKDFLKKCLSSNCSESVRVNIQQYLYAIEELTGEFSMTTNIANELVKLLKTKQGNLALRCLEEASQIQKIKLMRNIFEDVENKLKAEYPFLDNNENLIKGYDEEAKSFQHNTRLTDFYTSKSGIYPCLFWLYGKMKDPNNEVDEYDVVIALEFDWKAYVGVLLTRRNRENKFYNLFYATGDKLKNGDFLPKNSKAVTYLRQQLELDAVTVSESSTWWADWARVSAYECRAKEQDAPDFKTACCDDYFALYEDEDRNRFTDNIFKRFKCYVEKLDMLADQGVISKNDQKCLTLKIYQ